MNNIFSTKFFPLILVAMAFFFSNNIFVECADLVDNDITNLIAKDPVANAVDILDAAGKTTMDDFYKAFVQKIADIVSYIDETGKQIPRTGVTADKAHKELGRQALQLSVAAFEAIKETNFATTPILPADKTTMVTNILAVQLNQLDKATIYALLNFQTTAITFAGAAGSTPAINYNVANLLGAAHRVRLYLPDPLTKATSPDGNEIQALARFNLLIAELIPMANGYEDYSIAEANRIKTKPPMFEYNPSEKDVLMEVEKNFAWKNLLLDSNKHTDPTNKATVTGAVATLQTEYNQLLPAAIKKAHADFQASADTAKLVFATLTHLPKDLTVVLIGAERKRIDDALTKAAAGATPDVEAKLAVEEAFLYALLSATDYTTGITPQQKTDREEAIRDSMRFRRLHLAKDYNGMLDNPKTKQESANNAAKKEADLTTKKGKLNQPAAIPNDKDLIASIDKAIKDIQDADQNLQKNLAPTGGGGGPTTAATPPFGATVPIPRPPPPPGQTHQQIDAELKKEFEQLPPPRLSPDECQDEGTNCGEIMRMCSLPAYVVRMHQHCRRTCRVCFPNGEPCQDQFPDDCRMWAANGFCGPTNRIPKALKMMQCPETCGLCPP